MCALKYTHGQINAGNSQRGWRQSYDEDGRRYSRSVQGSNVYGRGGHESGGFRGQEVFGFFEGVYEE